MASISVRTVSGLTWYYSENRTEEGMELPKHSYAYQITLTIRNGMFQIEGHSHSGKLEFTVYYPVRNVEDCTHSK